MPFGSGVRSLLLWKIKSVKRGFSSSGARRSSAGAEIRVFSDLSDDEVDDVVLSSGGMSVNGDAMDSVLKNDEGGGLNRQRSVTHRIIVV